MRAGPKSVSSSAKKKVKSTNKARKLDAKSSNYPVVVETHGIAKKKIVKSKK